jgi:hypothetical protein
MNKRIVYFSLMISLTGGAVARADTELFACSESGSGPTYLKVCASDTGNVTLFKSPVGQEHIRVIDDVHGAREGFALCRWNPDYWAPGEGGTQLYYDFGAYYPPPGSWRDELGWDPPYKIEQPGGPNKFPLRVYRRTGDGLFELKQEFTVDSQEREVTVTTTLSNRSTKSQKEVVLLRMADLKVDNTKWDDSDVALKRSGIKIDNGPPDGGNRDVVSLSGPSNYPVVATYVDFGGEYVDACWNLPSDPGGWSDFLNGIAYHFGTLAPNTSRTVKFTYRAF